MGKISYGTCYFRSKVHAAEYYRHQYGAAAMHFVEEKIKTGEIRLGIPPHKPSESVFLIDGGTRWAINTNE